MKRALILLAATILISLNFSSCNSDPDNGDDEQVLPDLTASFSVTGAVSAQYSFMNPQNDDEASGQDLRGLHTSGDSTFQIIGLNDLNTYSYSIRISMPTLQSGTFPVASASFSYAETQPTVVFFEVVSGSVQVDDVEVLWTANGSTMYSASGSWTIELSDGQVPASIITFSGTFSNMAVIGT